VVSARRADRTWDTVADRDFRQEKYGPDKRLTESYQKDIWEYGS
jgi:hypothetical protein